jgi:hypothetical protein
VLAVLYPQKYIVVIFSVKGQGNPRAIVQLEGLDKLKELQ